MNEEELTSISSRRQKRKRKRRKRYVIFLVILLLLGSGGYATFIYLTPTPSDAPSKEEDMPTEKARQYTTFQTKIGEEYNAAKASFVGDESELPLVAKYFGMNLFTMWGAQNDTDYNGKDLIPIEYQENFNTLVRNNLYFRFDKMVEAYGANNLPIVTDVSVPEDKIVAATATYNGKEYDGYDVTLLMQYQDNTIEGTQSEDLTKTNELLVQWVKSADVIFFFIANESGGGQWYVGQVSKLNQAEL